MKRLTMLAISAITLQCAHRQIFLSCYVSNYPDTLQALKNIFNHEELFLTSTSTMSVDRLYKRTSVIFTTIISTYKYHVHLCFNL